MTYLVVMVAGMSSRFGGKPKQMALIGPNNETLIEYSINQAIKNPFEKIVFITNQKTEELFINIFKNNYKGIPVIYIQQEYDTSKRIRPWGTGDAIASLYHVFKNENCSNFILINGDDIYGDNTFSEGFNMIHDKDYSIIAGLPVKDTMPENGTVNRGIITIDNDNVIKLEERIGISKKDNPELMNQLANVNFIGLQIDALEHIYNLNNEFKNNNSEDSKIESLLTSHLNYIVSKDLIKLKYFYIKNPIYGITNPGDEIILKNIISK